MKSKFSLLLLGLIAASCPARAQDKSFHLKDGDCVVFYGDSITDQRLYTTFTETFVLTRFPKLNVRFVHSGWGGDRVSGGGGGNIDLRLQRDVFAYKPSVMTIMLGMNDGSYRAFDQEIFERYARGYERIVESVKRARPGIRLTLIQPSPFDDVTRAPNFEGGYNKVLVRYGQFVKELAAREGLHGADLNTAVVSALEKAKAADAETAKKIINDRVHPGPAGQLLMAAELLKAWNAPTLVASIEIDAAAGRVVANQTKVSNLHTNGKLSWTQSDHALPLAIDLSDPVMALAVSSSDFVTALNQQPLKVSGLSSANYELRIDDAAVGTFTREQLAEGVNLAALSTPMSRQASEVHKLTLQHNNLHFARWRQVEVPLAVYKSERIQKAVQDLMAALDVEEEEIVKQQRATAQPKEHRFELSPR
jgi:lysophospholipase L1-like esterase